MGAYKETVKLFKQLSQVASELGYSKENILILENKESELKRLFPNVWNNIFSCSHHRDKRTPFEYAQDLVASWFMEDYFLKRLKESGVEIDLNGADKERKILPNLKVSTNSDYIISFKGKTRIVEFMVDYTGYWTRSNKIDLRDNKYLKLSSNESLFIGLSTLDKKFILLDFKTEINAIFIPSHYPYGGKPAYTIKILDGNLLNFDVNDLVSKIYLTFE